MQNKIRRISTIIYFTGISLILIILSCLIWRFGSNLDFGFADSAYHLAVAQGFNRAGGITAWDFWDSLPIGRSHYYPPLLHLVLANILRIGFKPEVALKLMAELTVIGGMAVFAYGIKKLFNIKVAFWSIFFLFASVQFIRVSVTVMPATITIFLAPLLFYYFKERKWISYIIILTLMLYLHMFLPFIIMLGLAIYIICFERNFFWSAFKATLASLVLYLPWLTHILLGGLKYIKYFDSSYDISRYQNFPQTSLILLVLSIISVIILIYKKRLEKEMYFFFILSGIFVVLAFFSTNRMLNGHLLVCFSIFAALLFDQFLIKVQPISYCIIALSLLYFPNLAFNSKLFITPGQPTIAQVIFGGYFSTKTLEDSYQNLIEEVKNNSIEGESVGTAVSYFGHDLIDKREYQSNAAIYLAANSNRPTINLYQPEYNYRGLPDLARARIVLLSEPPRSLDTDYFLNYGYTQQAAKKLTDEIKENFALIGSYPTKFLEDNDDKSGNIYLYKNNISEANIIRENKPGFVFPLWLADSILIVMIILLVWDNKKLPRKITVA